MAVDGEIEQFDVFISYNRTNAAQVDILVTHLTKDAGLKVWIDRDRLQPGFSWRSEIESAMNSSSTVLIIWGSTGLGRVQLQERDLAYVIREERNDFSVLNVLLPDSKPPLRSWANVDTWIEFQGSLDEPDAFTKLVAAIKGHAPPSAVVAELPDEPAPYRGLEAFGTQNAQLFFGRTAHLGEMRVRLPKHPFLAVLGPSGSGKTSIVQAGLLADICSGKNSTKPNWSCQVMRPGPNPVRSLAAVLARLNPQTDPLTASDNISKRIISSPTNLPEVIQSLLPADHRLLLVVDRLEELYTLCESDQERSSFVDAIVAAAHHPHCPAWTVVTMRADFYGHLGRHADLAAEVVRHQIYLKPMTPAEVTEVIEAPAAQVGAIFEKGLAGQVRTDAQVQGEVALPLLQHTLDLLWQKRRGRWLTWDAYQEVGGISGALRYHADQVFENLNPAEREIARRLFTRLLWLEEGAGTITGRRVKKAALLDQSYEPSTVEHILQNLADARLVVLRGKDDQATAELIHDTLPLHWELLRGWVREDQEFLLWRQRLRGAIAAWERTDQNRDALLRGALLTEAERWIGERSDDMTKAEQNYIQEGLTRQAQETEFIERRRRRITTSAVAAAVIFMLLAAVTLFFRQQAVIQKKLAEDQRDIALRTDSRRLADLSLQQTAAGRPKLGILLALEALPKDNSNPNRPYVALAEAALYQALLVPTESKLLTGHTAAIRHSTFRGDGRGIVTASDDGTARLWDLQNETSIILSGHGGAVRHSAYSPYDRRIATASDDGTIRLWDALNGTELTILKGHTGPVYHAAFSPNGQQLLSASHDGTARLWNLESQASVVLSGDGGAVKYGVFSPDGRRIAITSNDGLARLWNAATSSKIASLGKENDVTMHVAFSPQSDRLATGSKEGYLGLWNVDDGSELTTIHGHKRPITHTEFSPNGKLIATTSEDGTARLWNTDDGSEIAVLSGHRGWVEYATFSPNGAYLVTASSDRTARLWEMTKYTEVAVLSGHSGAVEHASFSPDSRRLVTVSSDGTARLWDATRTTETATLYNHDGPVRQAIFTADGRRIITAGGDCTARLWDVAKGTEIAVLGGHRDVVWSIAYSDTADRIATASSDGTAYLWKASDGSEITVLKGHTGPVIQVSFTINGKRVATASEDGTARLWDAKDGTYVKALNGHDGWVNDVSFSIDGNRVATASHNGTVRLWDDASDKEPIVLRGHKGPVYQVVFSPDGKLIATASEDGTARLWDVSDSTDTVLVGHKGPVTQVIFSPNGKRIITASDDTTARVWGATNGEQIFELNGHDGPLTHVTYHPSNNHRILTASEDGTARLWDAMSGTEIAVLNGHAGAIVRYAAFDTEGSRIVMASDNGTVQVHNVYPTTQAMIDHAYKLNLGTLNNAQRKKYFISTP